MTLDQLNQDYIFSRTITGSGMVYVMQNEDCWIDRGEATLGSLPPCLEPRPRSKAIDLRPDADLQAGLRAYDERKP